MSNIKAIGTITKTCYCNKCFSIVTWDKADAEFTTLGNRYVICPKCGGHIDTEDATVDYSGQIENPAALINGVAYETVNEALDAIVNDTTITKATLELENSVTLEKPLSIVKGKDITLSLAKDVKLTTPTSIIVQGDLTIEGEGSIESSKRPITAYNGGTVTLKSGLIKSTSDCGIEAQEGGIINIEGGEVEAQEFGAIVFTGSKLNITDGVVTAFDNAAVGGNGTKGKGDTVINIKGGELISNIQSAGYVACGVYVPNTGTLNISGGKITANGGAGVVARGGKVNISGGEIIATGDATITGKVGDSKVVVPCSGVVYDKNSKYPGMDTLDINITGGIITGSKSSIEVLTNEEEPKIKVKGATLTPPYEG